MADLYSKWVLTNKYAQAEQDAANSGNQITFVRLILSADKFTFADLAGFNDTTLTTINAKQTVPVNYVKTTGSTVSVSTIVTSEGNTADYDANTLLLVASYKGAEFLAAAAIAQTPFRITAQSETELLEFTVRPQLTVSNTSAISIAVDLNAPATNERVTDEVATLDAKINDINTDKTALWEKLKDFVTLKGTQTLDGLFTFTQKITGRITNADSADKLATARKLKVNLASTADQTFNGAADQTGIGVNGTLPITNGGTGRTDGLAQGVFGVVGAATDDLTALFKTERRSFGNVTPIGAPSGASSYGMAETYVTSTGGNGVRYWYDYANRTSPAVKMQFASAGVWGSWFEISKGSDVVHNTGAETISGAKTWTAKQTFADVDLNNLKVNGTIIKPAATTGNIANLLNNGLNLKYAWNSFGVQISYYGTWNGDAVSDGGDILIGTIPDGMPTAKFNTYGIFIDLTGNSSVATLQTYPNGNISINFEAPLTVKVGNYFAGTVTYFY